MGSIKRNKRGERMKQSQEKLQVLQEMTKVDTEQAETALFDSDWDVLGALMELQESGLIEDSGVGRFSTATAPQPISKAVSAPAAEPLPDGLIPKLRWFWHFLVNNRLEAYKKYDPVRQIQCPLGALLALTAIAWYVVLGILFFGVCFGWRYRLAGPQVGSRRVNRIITAIDDWAERVRDKAAAAFFKK